ncbi:MAG: hypothetical protein H6819_01090 [Phycisphaerales bacterium]|nr:hypothetical protein [Phycisphaerales bacterium]MCB9857197.1 hypothetical protein [Phycisphaerales bacterium]MCB9863090.1 hypothetical protein [Phycisphaerales bacterium]
MKKLVTLTPIVLIVCAAIAFASEPPKEDKPETKEAVNTMCPISGRAIDGKTFIEYKGRRVGFCCPACDDKFLAWDDQKKDEFIAAQAVGKKGEAKEFGGDIYTLTKCVVTDEELGSMGDPPIKIIEGREVRVCCAGCFKKIEKDTKKYFDKMDKQMADDQRPHYPLDTCIVTHEPLKRKGKDTAYEYVFKNRLYRLCCKDCARKIEKDPARYSAELDAAVRSAQGKNYPLTTCPVTGEELGSMGEPVERIVANRLIRFCCSGCFKKFDAEPAKYIAKVDAARK